MSYLPKINLSSCRCLPLYDISILVFFYFVCHNTFPNFFSQKCLCIFSFVVSWFPLAWVEMSYPCGWGPPRPTLQGLLYSGQEASMFCILSHGICTSPLCELGLILISIWSWVVPKRFKTWSRSHKTEACTAFDSRIQYSIFLLSTDAASLLHWFPQIPTMTYSNSHFLFSIENSLPYRYSCSVFISPLNPFTENFIYNETLIAFLSLHFLSPTIYFMVSRLLWY